MLAAVNPSPFLFKTIMVGFDIGVMLVLILTIGQLSIKPSRLLLYAANPLVLLYIAGEGHLDVIQIFFLCLALYLIVCKEYHFSGFLMLGLAIMSKFFALIVLPFLVNTENRLKSLAVLVPLLLYLPFLEAGAGLFQSLSTFAADFHYNDSLSAVFRLLFDEQHLIATGIVLTISLAWVYLFVQNRLRSVYLALGCLLLLLPTLHPWYLVLIAPFLVFFPSRAWIYLQIAVVFTFPVIAIEKETGIFQEIFWLKWFEYIPFYVLLFWGLFREGYILRENIYKKCQTISAIIPTLNEASSIGRCIDSIKNRASMGEVIVSDGGSTDKTRVIANEMGVRVVETQPGRGIQINEGIKASSGDVIIILHADSVAARGVFQRVKNMLAAAPHVVGGAIGMEFEPATTRNRFIAFFNNLRTALTGISFGDQAQFFRKEALEAMGGFPAIMLMEDVELSLRLKEIGRLVFFRSGIVVSGRRWQGSRFGINLLTVLYLFTRYLIERRWGSLDGSMKEYYKAYYS
jgi:rSAM/selenodomain-associated transferase 2